jgi:serine/threonine protein kinase
MNTKEEYNFYEATMKCTKGTNIGSGANGQVYECENNKTFVIKEVTKAEHLENEKKFITYDKKCKYKHVAKMYNVESNDKALIIQKVDNILSDVLGKPDVDYLHANPYFIPLSSKDKIERNEDIILKLINSIKFLHSNVGYSHNDIKPENIGYNINKDGTKEIKYIDMGSSQVINNMDEDGTELKTLGYTYMYASPSTISGKFTKTKRDMWALAATIYEIVAGIPLFHILSKHQFVVWITLILSVNNESKIKYLLRINEFGKDGFPIIYPYIKNREIVQHHLDKSRDFFKIKEYPNKDVILEFLLEAFKADIDFNNNPPKAGSKTGGKTGCKAGCKAEWFFDKNEETRFVDNKKTVSTSNPLLGKENPLLGKGDDIYDFDEITGKITIKKLDDWKKIIDEIKEDIETYEGSDQYPEDLCYYYNKKCHENQTQLLVKGGTIYERKVITENKYNKEKMKKNNHVSRYKLKNGKFVYYMKKIRM